MIKLIVAISEGVNAVPTIFCNRSSKFIIESNSEGEMNKADSDSRDRQNTDPTIDINSLPSLQFQNAQFAPTTFQAFKLIVVFALIADFQLVVDYYLIKYSEEAIINSQKFQFIVAFIYSTISLHFCKDFGIFCEGVKEAIIDAIHRNNIPLLAFGLILAFGLNLAFGRNLAFGLNTAFGHNLAFGLTMAFGLIMAFGCNLAFGLNLAFDITIAFGCNLAFGLNLAFSHNLAFGLTMAFGLIMAFSLNNFVECILVG
jgi:hypothetical protein